MASLTPNQWSYAILLKVAAQAASTSFPNDHGTTMTDEKTLTEIEAAAFRRLVKHFQSHPEIQNIDLMITSGFCRNCLAKWIKAEAESRGVEMDYDRAREIIYGMPYEEWKARHQTEATSEQMRAYEERRRKNNAS